MRNYIVFVNKECKTERIFDKTVESSELIIKKVIIYSLVKKPYGLEKMNIIFKI